MTEQEFWDTLKAIRGPRWLRWLFGWRLKQEFICDGPIRVRYVSFFFLHNYCPVSAVANHLLGTNFMCSVDEPARLLGLDQEFALKVMAAADTANEGPREKLLEVLGL